MGEPIHDAAGESRREVFRQVGSMTRQLHDMLAEVGLLGSLRSAAGDLSDARGRLDYVVRKAGDSATRVLAAVEDAKVQQAHIGAALVAAEAALCPFSSTQGSAVDARQAIATARAAHGHVDARLTDILLAQDFHDLTGQVVAKVVATATTLETSLLALLLEIAPDVPVEATSRQASTGHNGPAIDAVGRDVVGSQAEVDDLLASLGF